MGQGVFPKAGGSRDPDTSHSAGWRRVKLCDNVSDTDESQNCALRQPALRYSTKTLSILYAPRCLRFNFPSYLSYCWTSVGAGFVSTSGIGAFAAVLAPGLVKSTIERVASNAFFRLALVAGPIS